MHCQHTNPLSVLCLFLLLNHFYRSAVSQVTADIRLDELHRQMCQQLTSRKNGIAAVGLLASRFVMLSAEGQLYELPPQSLGATHLNLNNVNVTLLQNNLAWDNVITVQKSADKEYLIARQGASANGSVSIIDLGTQRQSVRAMLNQIDQLWLSSSEEMTFFTLTWQDNRQVTIDKWKLSGSLESNETNSIAILLSAGPMWLCQVNGSFVKLSRQACSRLTDGWTDLVWPVTHGFTNQLRVYLFTPTSIYILSYAVFNNADSQVPYLPVSYHQFFRCQISTSNTPAMIRANLLEAKAKVTTDESLIIVIAVTVIVLLSVTVVTIYFCVKCPEKSQMSKSRIKQSSRFEQNKRSSVLAKRAFSSGYNAKGSIKKTSKRQRTSGKSLRSTVKCTTAQCSDFKCGNEPSKMDDRFGKMDSTILLDVDIGQPGKSDLNRSEFENFFSKQSKGAKAKGKSLYGHLGNGNVPPPKVATERKATATSRTVKRKKHKRTSKK